MDHFVQFYMAVNHGGLAFRVYAVFVVVTLISISVFMCTFIDTPPIDNASEATLNMLRILAVVLFVFVGLLPCAAVYFNVVDQALTAFHLLGLAP